MTLSGERILITGGTGFLGANLACRDRTLVFPILPESPASIPV